MIAQEGNSFFSVVCYFCPDIKELQDCQDLLPTWLAGCEPALQCTVFLSEILKISHPFSSLGQIILVLGETSKSHRCSHPGSQKLPVTERLEVLPPDKLDTCRNGTFPGDLSPTPSRHSPAWFCIKAILGTQLLKVRLARGPGNDIQ